MIARLLAWIVVVLPARSNRTLPLMTCSPWGPATAHEPKRIANSEPPKTTRLVIDPADRSLAAYPVLMTCAPMKGRTMFFVPFVFLRPPRRPDRRSGGPAQYSIVATK